MEQLVGVLKSFIKELRGIVRTLSGEAPVKKQKSASDLLTMRIKGLTAVARITPEGFLVLKGSQAVAKERPSMMVKPHSRNRRKSLIANKALVKKNGCFVFNKDVIFRSPTAAGEVVQAGTAQGPVLWKNPVGKTLKEMGWVDGRTKGRRGFSKRG